MPRQNRVTPHGELIAVPDRGMFWGNRGALLDRAGQVARYSRGQAWVTCVLSFKGRRRPQWTPGRLTELYFLDEATGLAAGHRPCGECRFRDYQAFKQAWARGVPPGGGGLPGVKEIDARLHADRLAGPGVRRTHQAPLAGLPSGTMVDIGGAPWLVHDGRLLAWTPGGYRARPAGAAIFENTALDPLAREVVVMTIATRNGCHICVAMHTARLAALGADPGLIAALRDADRAEPLPDRRLDAIRSFTVRVLDTAGDVGDAALRDLLASGYTTQNALEVVLGIGTYTMSTLANRLTGAPVDDQLAAYA